MLMLLPCVVTMYEPGSMSFTDAMSTVPIVWYQQHEVRKKGMESTDQNRVARTSPTLRRTSMSNVVDISHSRPLSPMTRSSGTEQSRSMEAILAECLDLASQGYKEVTLIGQVR